MTSISIRFGERSLTATIEADGSVRLDDRSFTVSRVASGLYRVSDGSRYWTVAVAGPVDDRWVHVDGLVTRLEIDRGAARSDRGHGKRGRSTSHDLAAPMPATVIRVLVEPGDRVARGDTLIVLEAMKMELPVRAPRDGVVEAVHCKAGELVQPGIDLLDLE